MPTRALVIAIENYSGSDSLARQLPGTNAAAIRFIQWLQQKKNLGNDAIYFCAAADVAGRTAGTTRAEIVAELARLFQAGRNTTGELYVFFSGHGFAYPVRRSGSVDVLVASDFVRPADSGGACIQVQEVQEKLWSALGPGDHYYFIDACRNRISDDQIDVISLGRVFPPSDLGKPTRYTLYSTALGEVASVNTAFPDALLSGLNGAGRAKEWRQARLYVTFDQLAQYVKGRMTEQDVEPVKQGSNSGFILELQPIPESTCTVSVEGAGPNDVFTLTIKDGISGMTRQESINGPTGAVKVRPNDYFLDIAPPPGVTRIDPPLPNPVDLFDNSSVRFAYKRPESDAALESLIVPLPPHPLVADATVQVLAGKEATVELENLNTGFKRSFNAAASSRVAAGAYRMNVRAGGETLHHEVFNLLPGQTVSRSLGAMATPLTATLARSLNVSTSPDVMEMSKFLGEDLARWGMPLLLSVLGAKRTTADTAEYNQFARQLPLFSFENLGRDQSGLRVLIALEHNAGVPEIALAAIGVRPAAWTMPREVAPNVSGLLEFAVEWPAGPALLWMKVQGQASFTYVTHLLPNRVTLLVLTDDASKQIQLHQYLLPVRHLTQFMDPQVRSLWEGGSPALLRNMFVAQQMFAAKRSVEPDGPGPAHDMWFTLINQKWSDPIMSLIAAYDLIRRGLGGTDGPGRRELLRAMVDNMRRFFSGIADVEAVAYLIGESQFIPPTPPLITDGVLAFDDDQEQRMMGGLPPNRVDYGSSWTVWRGIAR